MLYGFSLNKNAMSLYVWNEQHNRAEHFVTKLDNGKCSFENYMFLQEEGFLFGHAAFKHYVDQPNNLLANSFIEGIPFNLFHTPIRHYEARQKRLSGMEIAAEFFSFFSSLIAKNNDDYMIIETPSINYTYIEEFKACTSKLCNKTEYIPSWYLKMISAILYKPPKIANGRMMYIDLGECESCAVVVDIYYSPENKILKTTPIALKFLPETILSHKTIDEALSDELFLDIDNTKYNYAYSDSIFHKQKDIKIFKEASKTYGRQLTDCKNCDFSATNLYNNTFYEKMNISWEWFFNLLEQKGYIKHFQNMISRALKKSETSTDQVQMVYISKETGRMFRKTTEVLFNKEKIQPERRGVVCESAEGGAIILGMQKAGWTIELISQRQKVFCFFVQSPDGKEYIKESRSLNEYCFFRKKYIPGSSAIISISIIENNRSEIDNSIEGTIWSSEIPRFTGVADFMQFIYDGNGKCTISYTNRGKTSASYDIVFNQEVLE